VGQEDRSFTVILAIAVIHLVVVHRVAFAIDRLSVREYTRSHIGFSTGDMTMIARCAMAVTLLIACTSAQAETRGEIGRWLERYGIVAGAWFVNQRCHIFTSSQRIEFDWLVAESKSALRQRLSRPGFIQRVEEGGRAAAAMPEYASCGEASRAVVIGALPIARNLTFELTGRRYNAATSGVALAMGRFAAVTLALRVARRCNYVEPRLGADINRVYMKVLEALASRFGTRAVNLALNRGNNHPDATTMPCGVAAKQLYLAGLSNLRGLEREYAASRQ
jgi:hypothetical protein